MVWLQVVEVLKSCLHAKVPVRASADNFRHG